MSHYGASRFRYILVIAVMLLTAGIACSATADDAVKLSKRNYQKYSDQRAVLLINVYWTRAWGCHDNNYAQLTNLTFRKIDSDSHWVKDGARIELKGGGLLSSVAKDYQLMVPPGIYALAGYRMRLSREFLDTVVQNATEEHLTKGGVAIGGQFEVGAGEVVYVGDFYLDCTQEPILWRYYLTPTDGFRDYMDEMAKRHPYLDRDKVIFRLFQSDYFSQPIEIGN